MGKISILEIANVLIEKKGLSPKSVELFISTMFDIIQTGLERDKSVKIKGLGTFKIIEVEARESINVNTGERVVIESHGKITFTPDTIMKELVNKPFSQFETVILNEGVEFDDIDDSANASKTTDSLSKNEETSEPQIIDVIANSLDKTDTENDVDREKIVEDYINKIASQDLFNAEPTINNEAESESTDEVNVTEKAEDSEEEAGMADVVNVTDKAEDSEEEAGMADEPVKETEIVDQPEVETGIEIEKEEAPTAVTVPPPPTVGNTEEEVDEECEYEGEEDEEEEQNKSSFLKWFLFSLFMLVLILSAAYGGYLYGLKVATENHLPVTNDTVAVQQLTVVDNKQESDTVTVKDTTKTDSIKTIVKDTIHTTKPASTDNKPVPTVKFDSEKYEQMDSRVRTGAYRIIGTDYTVVIRQGETMKRLCKRTLGEGMACYIEVYNDMEPNGKLIAGKTIKIPKLEWKKKRKQ